MLKKIVEVVKGFFKGHERTVKAKKNVLASFFVKGLSMIIGILMIRVTYNYLDQTKYGIWLTLSSFLTWFSFFEIGLGNGLKNKLAEALANKSYALGKIYVSTTYAILSIVIFCIAVIFFIANFFIDWTVILNTEASMAEELSTLALIIFGFFFLRFVIKLISIVLYADQRPAVANTFGPIGNLIVLIIIYILTLTTEGSLIYLGVILSVTPLLVLVIASIYFYKTEYKHIAPSVKDVDFSYAKDLLNLGVKFFLIQISGLIIFQSSLLIIAQFFGPAEVTVYYIAHKYFSLLNMIFAIVVAPFWAAYTEAWTKKDIVWIKNTVKKLLQIWVGFVCLGLLMLLVSNYSYVLISGDKNIEIPLKLSIVLLIYFVTFTYGGVFVMFINGVGKIKLQMYSAFIGAIVFILSSILMIKYFNLGIIGLVLAMILSNFNGLILAPIQYKKIINNKAKGIWNL